MAGCSGSVQGDGMTWSAHGKSPSGRMWNRAVEDAHEVVARESWRWAGYDHGDIVVFSTELGWHFRELYGDSVASPLLLDINFISIASIL